MNHINREQLIEKLKNAKVDEQLLFCFVSLGDMTCKWKKGPNMRRDIQLYEQAFFIKEVQKKCGLQRQLFNSMANS